MTNVRFEDALIESQQRDAAAVAVVVIDRRGAQGLLQPLPLGESLLELRRTAAGDEHAHQVERFRIEISL